MASTFYSFIPLLLEMLNQHRPNRVLEWGMGISTAITDSVCEVCEIHTFEHNPSWFRLYNGKYSSRVKCYLIPVSRGYAQAGNLFPKGYFDFAFVDGEQRVQCMQTAKTLVKVDGFVMLHDSDRPKYKDGVALFKAVKELGGTLLMSNSPLNSPF